MVEARKFKFGRQIAHWGDLTKKCEIKSKGVVKGSRDLSLEFWDPSISRERLKLETSNLAHRLTTGAPNEKSKIRSKGVVMGSCDILLEFRDPSISRERLKLETSNLAHKLATGVPNEKNAKLGERGPLWGHMTYF